MAKKTIQGKVVAKSGDKTARILVERKVLHPKYRKIVKKFKHYLIHDENNELNIGDFVLAEEFRPISKRKTFILKSVISKAGE